MYMTFVLGLRVQNPLAKYPLRLGWLHCWPCFRFFFWTMGKVCPVSFSSIRAWGSCLALFKRERERKRGMEGVFFFFSFLGPLCLSPAQEMSAAENERKRKGGKNWGTFGLCVGLVIRAVSVFFSFSPLPSLSVTLTLYVSHTHTHTHSGEPWKKARWLMTLCERPQRQQHYREMDRWKGKRRVGENYWDESSNQGEAFQQPR